MLPTTTPLIAEIRLSPAMTASLPTPENRAAIRAAILAAILATPLMMKVFFSLVVPTTAQRWIR
jgi:hypothetical protein